MSERARARLRIAVIALATLNVLFFVYLQFASNDRAAARRIEQLQINPERIKMMAAATRGSGAQPAAGGASIGACLQWGPLAASDISRADAALGELKLPQTPIQRRLQNDRYAYLLREPDAGTIAKIADLQRGFAGSDLRAVPCPL